MLDEIQARKKQRIEHESSYIDLSWIQPTSNIVERFFSQVKAVFTDYRRSLLAENLEAIMFLKLNSDLWDVSTVADAIEALEVQVANQDDLDSDDESEFIQKKLK